MSEGEYNEAHDLLIFWITERDRIWMKKELGVPKPWTHDKILQQYRFCNVDRCNDTVTKWIFENIIKGHRYSDTLYLNLAVARFINWPPTLEALGYFEEWDPDLFCHTIEKQMKKGKTYTGAYMIRAGTGEDAKKTKQRYLCDRVFTPLWELRDDTPDRYVCKDWDRFFSNIFGMGEFMRNQIITDMKYSPLLPCAETPDWENFVLIGPGTSRGLDRLAGRPLTTNATPTKYKEILELRHTLVEELLYICGDTTGNKFSLIFKDMNNLANSLCEFDKYMRVLNKEGRPRSKYPGDK